MHKTIDEIVVGTRQASPTGMVFDIQGHSVHDGPGTRTTVFLNGCPLSCIWCSNPEGLHRTPVLMHRASRCQKCGNCISSCLMGSPHQEDGVLAFNRELCDVCTTHECISTCYHEALITSGKRYSVDELAKIFQRDRQFWGARGGVTFSGGEPLMQKRFISALLKRCKEMFIHTCIETTSCLPTDFYLEIMKYVDWVFTDIKHMDSARHKELTGVDNQLILKNIALLAKQDWNGVIMPRVPIIPGKNDSDQNLKATADFIHGIGLDAMHLLPFHRLGESKYTQLGRSYAMADQPSPSDEHMQHLKRVVESRGLLCFVGSDTPF
ncbi:MAG: glycyl-radical enzyme activating protein [Halodesulfovibrio sp.]